MSKLFPNHIIDLDNGTVYSTKRKKFCGQNTSFAGYHQTFIKDYFGNYYYNKHEIIIAEGLNLPKHLWPTEENGRRYIVDHILPVKNGGTDSFKNLHLIPKPDNSRNEISRENFSKVKKGIQPEHLKKLKGELHPMYGKHLSEKTKKKMSEAQKGEKNHMFGKHITKEVKKKMSESNKGKHNLSDWHKKKLLETNSKPVIQYKINGDFVAKYSSVSEAARINGFSIGNISSCCLGKRKTHKNFKWEFI